VFLSFDFLSIKKFKWRKWLCKISI